MEIPRVRLHIHLITYFFPIKCNVVLPKLPALQEKAIQTGVLMWEVKKRALTFCLCYSTSFAVWVAIPFHRNFWGKAN